jgi:hypothetical protein
MSIVRLTVAALCVLLLRSLAYAGELKPYEAIDRHALKARPEDEASIPKLAKFLAQPCKTDKEKARVIYRWITDRITYDVETLFARKTPDDRIETVLTTRKAACGGYVNLFLALSNQMKLQAVKIAGDAKVLTTLEGPKLRSPNHVWNAVKLEGKWFLIDTTMGSGSIKNKKAFKRLSELYFLTPPEKLIFSHFPLEARWQLLNPPLSLSAFQKLPFVDQRIFELGATPEVLHATMKEKSFREFVHAFEHPGLNTTMIQAPLSKHLQSGKEYEFSFKSDDYDDIVIDVKGKRVRLVREGTMFRGRVQLEKGIAHVIGKVKWDQSKYSGILQYIVE